MNTTGKILIVDDKVENLVGLEKVMAPLQAEFIRAASGNEALKATLRYEFALAILDVHMPEMDGYELLQLLRGQKETKNLPVILLTAHFPDETNIVRGYESGAVDYLTKPFNPDILLSKAQVFLEFDRNRRELLRQKIELESLARERDLLNKRLSEEKELLEERVRSRTLELEQVNRAKDDFLANMSHEIRTPLSGVFGMTEVLLQQDLPQSVRQDLEVISSSSTTVLSLLNDLLDLSRIEKGKLKIEPKAFDLSEMLEDIFRLYSGQAEEKGIILKCFLEEDVPKAIMCDPDRLSQVLKNLLSNALKFTLSGSIRLSVHKDPDSNCRNRLRFSVSDTGPGIPREKLQEIFHPFTQLDFSYSKKFSGSGLGLAISKRIVELMGGKISVTSEPGQGTTFSFTMIYEQAAPKKENQSDSIDLSHIPSLHILLAEDTAVNRLFLKRALSRAGHIVEEAENGLEVLEKLENNRFDLVLMDIQMPEMDGVETTRVIRSYGHKFRDIPIIALTAYAMKGDKEKFLKKGMDGYVTKPVDFEELARVIADACNPDVSRASPR